MKKTPNTDIRVLRIINFVSELMTKIDNLELRQEIDLWEKHKKGSFKGAGSGFILALNGVRNIISKLEAKQDPQAARVKPSPRLEIISLPEEVS